MMDIEQSAATEREQRMQAVAKLKRAASLPRLKDGRRPPMHNEAVSEGEKGNLEEDLKPDVDTPPPEAVEEPVGNEPVERGTPAEEVEVEDLTVSPPPTRSKRRSRSRSRSRGSRDFKGKARAQQSPTPTLIQGDSSQDEAFIPSQITLPVIPQLISPVPSQLQRSMLLSRTPTPTSQEHPLFPYPGTSPPTPLPTLEALQKGLFRSNSAGRMMAMHKLTGGTEIYEPSPSPTPPISAKFRRNNTVSGGERSAARKKLIDTLGSRSKATAPSNTDVEQGSGADEPHTPQAPSPSPTPKRRRRRSRRGSSAGGAGSLAASDLDPATSSTPQVPPTPPPPSSLDNYPDIRALTATPNQASSSGAHSPRNPSPLGQADEAHSPPVCVNVLTPVDRDRPERTRRRSVVVEEEEEDQSQFHSPPPFNPPPLPSTPPNVLVPNGINLRVPHSSDPPSDMSGEYTTTSGINIPVYISHSAPSREDGFPSSPFGTPLKEKPSRDEEEEERVLYPADTYRDRSMYGNDNEFEREISWVASPVPEIRMPIHDDDDDGVEDDYGEEQNFEDRPSSPQSSGDFYAREGYENISPRASSGSQIIGGESETSPDTTPSYVPPSPSSVAPLSGAASVPQESDGSVSPTSYPTRLSVASRIQGELSPRSPDFGDLDPPSANDVSSKRSGDSTSTSTWEKVKNTFRSNSSLGRRSRSNSIVTPSRRDQTESSFSRESGASLTSPKLEKSESTSAFAAQQGQAPMMSPSASNSILSLSPTPGSRSGSSPVPPPSSADLSKYQNAKLFPFPGMKKLEEERNRAKGLHMASASTPDINAFFSNPEDGTSPMQTSGSSYTSIRPQLAQKVSDSNLVGKFMAPPLSSTTSSSQSSHPDYFNITPSPSTPTANPGKLPMTLPAVKQWLSKNLKPKVSSQGPPISPASPPPVGNGGSFKKPSFTDLLRIRKDNELGPEWEELGNTSTDTSGNTLTGVKSQSQSPLLEEKEHIILPMTPPATSPIPFDLGELPEVEKTPKAQRNFTSPIPHEDNSRLPALDRTTTLPSPPDVSSTTPDPSSSLSDYPAPSTSDSSSTSSRYSAAGFPGPQGSIVLQQLEEQLSRSSRSPMWAAAIDDPPRKLILSSPVLQVVNSNTVKDRFLFLFNDILIIAKPVLHDDDVVTDRPIPFPERRFIVKSVVQLQHLRVASDRNEPSKRTSGIRAPPRNPIIRTFVHNFSKDPDYAISALFSKSGTPDDPILLGQLLFRTTEIDRVQLGSYLSQRTSKLVLKSYLDSFGFVHLRVDRALRVFLLSLHVPSRSVSNHSALEYLLDAFASRWYEANARFIAYDKDLAIRLVRGLNQLNDLLHGGLASEPGLLGTPRRNITSRDFIDAFRRCDPKCLVSDELLEDIYQSIRLERLCHARNTQATGTADIIITNKRPLPPRLTYKVTSEPVSFRIPQPDPQFCIHLYGQDLIIDPPVLTFEKSSEARFRVTGTSLGPKTIIMHRSGPNALKYAGLPLALRITIERAFMRHTFQVAFVNHCGNKRRYMFSVDDALIRHQWTVSLRQHVDNAISSAATSSASPGPSKFYRAAETVAFRVLQEILIGQAACSGPARVMEAAIERLTDPRINGFTHLGVEHSPPNSVQRSASIPPLHVRSKSRSKVYHRTKAGKNESDITMNGRPQDQDSFDNVNGTKTSSPGSSDQQPPSVQSDSPTWNGRDLEMQCLQNSSIALVLSFLQVGSPEHGLRSS